MQTWILLFKDQNGKLCLCINTKHKALRTKKKKNGSIHVCVHVQKSKSKVKNINKKTDMQIYTFGIKTAQIIESLIRYTVNKIKFF